MENISYIGLSQQIALTSMMNVTANNVANMSTPGYKGQRMLFIDYLNKGKDAGPKDAIHQVEDYATYRNTEQGSLQMTSNPLDVALEGEGYFAVSMPDGSTSYTRNGSFSLNGQSQLVTKQGYPVLSDGGQPLVLPEDARHITITEDGQISTEQGEVGQLQLTGFDDQQKMQELGDGLYAAGTAQQTPATNTRMVQSAIEGSNVNPILEMNRMVEVLRAYQSTFRMLSNDHERIRTAIQKLTKV